MKLEVDYGRSRMNIGECVAFRFRAKVENLEDFDEYDGTFYKVWKEGGFLYWNKSFSVYEDLVQCIIDELSLYDDCMIDDEICVSRHFNGKEMWVNGDALANEDCGIISKEDAVRILKLIVRRWLLIGAVHFNLRLTNKVIASYIDKH